ncbi:MAG: fumarate hydratase C-terminal domain-containing protein [Methanobacterium sp.]|nr:fumarate hydratase C-terminal domain-containing protein [Methanobacterium sp.]
MKKVEIPLKIEELINLQIGDKIEIYGAIYTGRDAALPKLVEQIKKNVNIIPLKGSAIMHTAVSDAGISPTTSNKVEIASCIPVLSQAGVKMHIGKGSLDTETIEALLKYNSIFVVTPPAAALLKSKVVSKKVIAFPEEGIEAIYQLNVEGIPGVVAVANGKTL